MATVEAIEGDEPLYTIDELAARSGVPSRTIRFYQSKGTLPAPERRGRVAYYRPEHVERLKVIAELQDRGLRLDAIRDLVENEATAARSVAEWLGLDAALAGPWSEDRPRIYDADELAALLKDRPAGILAALERSRLINRDQSHPDLWMVHSPGMLKLALRLLDVGVAVELSGRAADVLRRRMSKAADELVSLFAAAVEEGMVAQATDEWAEAIKVLRPIAREASGLILAQELERSVRQWMDAGGTPREAARKRKR
jgi:DNA-binding transcriptional MerR regulator